MKKPSLSLSYGNSSGMKEKAFQETKRNDQCRVILHGIMKEIEK